MEDAGITAGITQYSDNLISHIYRGWQCLKVEKMKSHSLKWKEMKDHE